MSAALAAMTQRAEAAVEEKHEWAGRNLELVFEMETVKRERDELAAKLAAVPVASLVRIVEAVLLAGEPLRYDLDIAEAWAQRKEAQP